MARGWFAPMARRLGEQSGAFLLSLNGRPKIRELIISNREVRAGLF